MTHIICRATHCLFWEEGVCSADEIEYEPDTGCLTFQDIGDLDLDETEEDGLDWEEPDDELFEDDDSDTEYEDADAEDDWEEAWGDDGLQ